MRDKELAIARGERAKQIVEDPLFKEAVVAIKAKMFSDFQATKWGRFGSKQRDEIHRKLQCLDAIEGVLLKEMQTGKIALEQMKQEDKRQRKRR